MRLPDFIIGGAPRSGTTWLYRVLARHPAVHMAQPERPEPKFFLVDEEYARGLASYSDRWFANAREQKCGEKSTDYLESPIAAGRIARDIPGVRMIFILREPAARAYSNYAWSVMNGLEPLGLEEAIRAEPAREAAYPTAHRYSRPHSYFSRGLYARLLRPYLELFARDQVLVLRFEDIVEAPADVTERVHSHIGVPSRPRDCAGMYAVNASEPTDRPEAVMTWLRDRYRGPNEELAALLGPTFRGW